MSHQGWRGCKQVDTFPALDDGSFHCHRSMDIVQFKVKAASVANSVAAAVTTPERCGGCSTVCTDEVLTTGMLLVERWAS